MNIEDKPHTLREVAAVTGLSLRSIEIGCRTGTIKATPKGAGTKKRHWVMYPEQIRELLDARTTGQTVPVQPVEPEPADDLAAAIAASRRLQARSTPRRRAA